MRTAAASDGIGSAIANYRPAIQLLSSTQRPVEVRRRLPAGARSLLAPTVLATRAVAVPSGRTIEVTRPVELSAGIEEPLAPWLGCR
jgi:hypothetical protein